MSRTSWDKITIKNAQVGPVPTKVTPIYITSYEKVKILPNTTLKSGTIIKAGFPNYIDYPSVTPVPLSSVDCSKYKSASLKSANVKLKTNGAKYNIDGDLLKDIIVCPNPASDYIVVSSRNVPISSLRILNSTGVVIQHFEKVNTNMIRTNITSYMAGLYIIQINLVDGDIDYRKILKQ